MDKRVRITFSEKELAALDEMVRMSGTDRQHLIKQALRLKNYTDARLRSGCQMEWRLPDGQIEQRLYGCGPVT